MRLTGFIPTRLDRLRGRGISFRLFILVTLILLPLGALLGLTFQQRYQARKQNALQMEMEVAQGLAVTFTAYVHGIQIQSLSLGNAITILSPATNERLKDLLIASLGHSVSVVSVNWVSPEGRVLASSAAGYAETDLSEQPFFRKVMMGRDLVLGDMTARGVDQTASLPIATAIRNKNGRLEGVVLAWIEPTRLGEALAARPDGAVALFDSRGTLVYHSLFHSPSWRTRAYWRESDTMVSRVLSTGLPESGTRAVSCGDAGGRCVGAARPIPGLGWVAAANQPMQDAFAEVRRGMVMDSLLGAAAFALAFLLAYLLGRNIIAPLRRLENDARDIGQGMPVNLTDPRAPAEVVTLRATMLAMAADLTQRAHELQDSEALLRTVIENVYDGIVLHDGHGLIVDVNERWLKMFRLTREESKSLTIEDISADAPPVEELVALWGEVLAGETKLFEWHARRPGDDSRFDVEVFLCAIRLKGRDLIMACVRDITDRNRIVQELQRYRDELEIRVQERTEELARAFEEIQNETGQRLAAVEELRRKEQLLIQQSRLAAMGEMMGNIAHQWRQPLNILGLIVQELKYTYRNGSFTGELLAASVAKAMTVIGHMSQTIEDFRNLLSPDRVKVLFSAHEVVQQVLSIMQLEAEVEVFAEDECFMEGSRNEYSQVIINILANAQDVFRECLVKNARITVRLFRQDGRSVVTIADNGGGIAGAIIDSVFDPYFTTKGPDKGTGLGLFMSKTIIEKSMNGALTVRNIPGGAEFRIEV